MKSNVEKRYIGTYKVYRVYRESRRHVIIDRGLTREEAIRIVSAFPSSNKSMVVFDKQFTADKYYV